MSTLQISLFGTMQITHRDRQAEIKIAPKAQTLLAYLLLHGPRFHPRERLADLFWGDYTAERARSCLSTTLWRLRRALEPNGVQSNTYLLTTATDKIGFNWDSDHWLDVTIFEAQTRHLLKKSIQTLQTEDVQILEETLALAKEDLLHSLYENWAIREQERLRGVYLDCLGHLMRYYRQQGFYDRSLDYGRRILEREPLREEIHREMMRLYLESGQRAKAVQQYQNCRGILAQALDIPPMEETEALYAQIVNSSGQPQTLASMAIKSDQLQRALKQLSQARHNFDQAQTKLRQASQRLDRAQQQLQQALRLIEQLADP